MNRQDEKKQNKAGKLVGVVILMLIYMPWLTIPALVLGVIGYGVYKSVVQPSQSGEARKQIPSRGGKSSFDDCPQPLFCFHKDKGEHHVRRGKEIDPWDRPDIDISKYQRKG